LVLQASSTYVPGAFSNLRVYFLEGLHQSIVISEEEQVPRLRLRASAMPGGAKARLRGSEGHGGARGLTRQPAYESRIFTCFGIVVVVVVLNRHAPSRCRNRPPRGDATSKYLASQRSRAETWTESHPFPNRKAGRGSKLKSQRSRPAPPVRSRKSTPKTSQVA
jgi:hypothetical protein